MGWVMKRLSSCSVIGLFAVLLMPIATLAQSGTDPVVEVPDPVGDIVDMFGLPAEAPAFLDVTLLRLSIEDEHLVASFEVAGDWPIDDMNGLDVSYSLGVERVGDDPASRWVKIAQYEGEWSAEVWEWEAGLLSTLPVDISVEGLTVHVPLSLLGPPSDLRFRAQSDASDFRSDDPEALRSFEATEVDGQRVVTSGEEWRQWYDNVPDAYDAWLTLDAGVVTWTPPPPPGMLADPCEITVPPFGLPETIRTEVGKVAVEMVDLDACPWTDMYDPDTLTELLTPLGKDLDDVQLASAGRIDDLGRGSSSWSGEMWAVRVAGMAPMSLVIPLLDTVGSGHAEMRELTTRVRMVDGRRVWVITAPLAEGCYLYSITGEVLVVSPVFGCDLGELPALQAAVGRHLGKVWRSER